MPKAKHPGIRARIPANKAVVLARSASASYWEHVRKKNALDLFKKAAKEVPAYKKFLEEHGIQASTVKTWEDFTKIPATSKANYLRVNPPESIVWKGNLARPSVYSATSGSTGTPFYFQRSQNLEEEYSALIELFFLSNGTVPSPECPTLVIIGFGMGVWIGGMLTFRAYEIASHRGYPVSILPAGVNKNEILHAFRNLAPHYKQTILIGYPPFIKDILDEAALEGIDLKSLHLRLQFAAESFTEQFREYVGTKAGIQNIVRDTFNVYGTSDIGAMAFETPVSILVRRLALQNPELYTALFGSLHKMPTVAQYNPAYMTFEQSEEGEVLLTGNSAVPLIRYAVGDHGGVRSYEEVNSLCNSFGIDLEEECKKHEVPLYKFPFVYVYERADLATTLYGLQIFPQYIKDVLLSDFAQEKLTGKFQLATKYDAEQNQFLEINVELKKGVDAADAEFIQEIEHHIYTALLEKSSEFRELSTFVHNRKLFVLVFHEAGNAEFFPQGIKQKWVQKTAVK